MSKPAPDAELDPSIWRRSVLDHIRDHPDRPLKTRALARALRLPDSDYTTFRRLIRELLEDGTIDLGPGRTLRLPARGSLPIGVFRANRRGFGFVERPGEPALFVARHQTHGARDGDTVAVRILPARRGEPGPRAQVVDIIERSTPRCIGLLRREARRLVVRPLGAAENHRVLIESQRLGGAQPGEIVVVELDAGTADASQPHGRVVTRLGPPDLANTWIQAAIIRHGLPAAYPPAAGQHAERLAAEAARPADADREDLRECLCVTIDPPDARDFDDAISVDALPGGALRLGVHIADVTYFVRPDDPIDREARRRGTSVYFPGFVVPMLPEALSNGLCSLKPGEDRLTRSVFLTYDRHGRVQGTHFARSLIRSRARLTYAQAQAALDGEPGHLPAEVVDLLRAAAMLATRIRRRRIAQGMITLDLPEAEIQLTRDGKVRSAHPARTGFANTLIEMFMVEANEAVSRALTEAGLAHLRRVHPPPGPEADEALGQLRPLLGGHRAVALDRASIRAVLERVDGRPEQAAVSGILLRAMAQAHYAASGVGHFALASDDYCHFTSPIRRYPDVTVHRLLDAVIDGRADEVEQDEPALRAISELGRHCSSAERRAQQAERDVRQALTLLLMQRHVGDVFDGSITGVTSFGIFVQLRPTLAEGLLPLAALDGDTWSYERHHSMLRGRTTGRVIHVGQDVRVKVARVDVLARHLDLVPARGCVIGTPGQKAPRARSKPPRRRR